MPINVPGLGWYGSCRVGVGCAGWVKVGCGGVEVGWIMQVSGVAGQGGVGHSAYGGI